MGQVTLNARQRVGFGSRNAGRLRRSGRIPGVIYGSGAGALAIDLDNLEFVNGVRGISESTIVKLVVDGKERQAFVKDTQRDILSGSIVHVDFYEVESGKLVRARVPLHFSGSPIGVREGGILESPIHEVEVECLPRVLPEKIDLDLSTLGTNQSIHVRDLKLAPEVKVLTSGDQVIAVVKFAKAEAVEAEPQAEEAAPAPAEETTE